MPDSCQVNWQHIYLDAMSKWNCIHCPLMSISTTIERLSRHPGQASCDQYGSGF